MQFRILKGTPAIDESASMAGFFMPPISVRTLRTTFDSHVSNPCNAVSKWVGYSQLLGCLQLTIKSAATDYWAACNRPTYFSERRKLSSAFQKSVGGDLKVVRPQHGRSLLERCNVLV
ncbi:hypothetical protein [Bacteroides heparinolyticus]|uniref:hypothetical protein n=1 Tax=Prevotella heparinolytica TaxID=28113 RepID=UPI003F9EF780